MSGDVSTVLTAAVPSTALAPAHKRKADDSDASTCPYCHMPKVLAESRLHRGWLYEDDYHHSPALTIEDLQNGLTLGCNICGLILDAIENSSVYVIGITLGAEAMSLFSLSIERTDLYCLVEVRSDFQTLSVFVAEGMDHYFAQILIVLKALGANTDCTADQHVDVDTKSTWDLHRLPHPSGDTSSLQAVHTIQRWISTCKNEHKNCKHHDQSRWIPKRILRLSTTCVQLCENLNSKCEYACLSHCWGPKGPALKLGSDTITELTAGIPINRLPKTFQDAVMLCLSLDIQYLWIDALCILQDNTKDWEEAAASMADVYSHANITIAATWSDDSNGGCFSQMQPELEDRPLQEPGVFVRVIKPQFPRFTIDPVDRSWPLLDRGWVYQERKLSARMVHMAKEQLYWECDSAFLSEDGYEDIQPLSSGDLRSPMEDLVIAWRSAVEQYSRLKLTYEDDRLPAISALVRRMQHLREGDVYLAGLWLNTILQDLAWYTYQRGGSTQIPRPNITCPTWSWVATAHGVHWYPAKDLLPSLRLLDITYNITGPAHFGQTANARIKLEGPAMTAEYTAEASFVLNMMKIHGPYRALEGQRICGMKDFNLESADPPILPEEVFDILLMTIDSFSCGGIILHKLPGERYERVGWVRIFYGDIKRPEHHLDWTQKQALEDFVASLPIKQFTIV